MRRHLVVIHRYSQVYTRIHRLFTRYSQDSQPIHRLFTNYLHVIHRYSHVIHRLFTGFLYFWGKSVYLQGFSYCLTIFWKILLFCETFVFFLNFFRKKIFDWFSIKVQCENWNLNFFRTLEITDRPAPGLGPSLAGPGPAGGWGARDSGNLWGGAAAEVWLTWDTRVQGSYQSPGGRPRPRVDLLQ